MALTIAQKAPHKVFTLGDLKGVLAEVTFDSSYPTGGESLTAADLGLKEILGVTFLPTSASGGNIFEYDYTNSKVLVKYFDYSEATDNVAIERTNTTDLATVVVRALVVGH